MPAVAESLIGSWKLVSFDFEFEDGQRRAAYDDAKSSLIIIPDGRYVAIVADNARRERDQPSVLLDRKSYSGEFLLPTPETIHAAAAALTPRTPADQRLTLVNAPGARAYPLINYEYAVVSTKQANPAIAAAIRRFLLWAIAPDETNEKYLQDAHFIPLPAHVWVLSYDQIQSIK